MTIAWAADMVQVVHEFESPLYHRGLAMVQHGISAEENPTPAMAQTLYGLWEESFLDLLDSQVRFARTRVLDEVLAFEHAGNLQGGNNSVSPPPNTTLLVNANVPLRSPRARSRMYPPHLVTLSDVQEDGVILPAVVAGRQARFDDYHEALIDAGFQPRVVQNVEGNSPPISPWPAIVSWNVNGRVATQRRRLR